MKAKAFKWIMGFSGIADGATMATAEPALKVGDRAPALATGTWVQGDPMIAERMTKTCLILPCASPALETFAEMAETSIKRGKDHMYFLYFEFGPSESCFGGPSVRGCAVMPLFPLRREQTVLECGNSRTKNVPASASQGYLRARGSKCCSSQVFPARRGPVSTTAGKPFAARKTCFSNSRWT